MFHAHFPNAEEMRVLDLESRALLA